MAKTIRRPLPKDDILYKGWVIYKPYPLDWEKYSKEEPGKEKPTEDKK